MEREILLISWLSLYAAYRYLVVRFDCGKGNRDRYDSFIQSRWGSLIPATVMATILAIAGPLYPILLVVYILVLMWTGEEVESWKGELRWRRY
jgi:hypothetical protein